MVRVRVRVRVNSPSKPALLFACSLGHAAIVRQLAEAGAEVDATTSVDQVSLTLTPTLTLTLTLTPPRRSRSCAWRGGGPRDPWRLPGGGGPCDPGPPRGTAMPMCAACAFATARLELVLAQLSDPGVR